jgi:uncharacterized protein YlxP (DUF503 family)
MHVAVARFTLLVPSSHSLKDKRGVLRRIKDRVQQRFHVTLAEVAGQDTWQRVELAFSLVTAQRDQAEDAVASIVAFVEAQGLGELAHSRHEVTAYGDDWYQAPANSARSDDDQSWVPAAWLADEGEEGSR